MITWLHNKHFQVSSSHNYVNSRTTLEAQNPDDNLKSSKALICLKRKSFSVLSQSWLWNLSHDFWIFGLSKGRESTDFVALKMLWVQTWLQFWCIRCSSRSILHMGEAEETNISAVVFMAAACFLTEFCGTCYNNSSSHCKSCNCLREALSLKCYVCMRVYQSLFFHFNRYSLWLSFCLAPFFCPTTSATLQSLRIITGDHFRMK